MLNKYICPKCTRNLIYSNIIRQYECKSCNYTENELVLKKEQSFFDEHPVNRDDALLNDVLNKIKGVKKMELDSFYLSTGSAKKDLEKKYNYVQYVIEEIKTLEKNNNLSIIEINKTRELIFKKLYEISYLILNEIYGAYNVNSIPEILHNVLNSNNIYELSRNLNKNFENIDLNNAVSTQITVKELTKEQKKYKERKSKELGKKFDRMGNNAISLLSTTNADKKAELQGELIIDGASAVLDVGFNLVAKGFNAIGESISNRIDVFERIRNTDKELNNVMEKVNNNFISIEDITKKHNQLLNINYNTFRVLEYSFMKLQKNVLINLQKIPVYKEYKVLKEPLEKNKLYTDMGFEITKQSIYLNENFLKFTFMRKKKIFDHLWKAKVYYFFKKQNNTMISSEKEFLDLQHQVSNNISSFKDICEIKKENDKIFIDLDNKVREILNKDFEFNIIKKEIALYVSKVFINIKLK